MVTTFGNTDLLKLPKTAFLCSRKIPASAVLKCYDWALEQRNNGHCVISGFHSPIEKDVLHFLLMGKQPVIMALARGMKKRMEPEITGAVQEGRLLLVTPFEESVKRVTSENAEKRNRLMIDLADEVVVGFAGKGGLIEGLIGEEKNKKVHLLHR